jgi:hypothetical protein
VSVVNVPRVERPSTTSFSPLRKALVNALSLLLLSSQAVSALVKRVNFCLSTLTLTPLSTLAQLTDDSRVLNEETLKNTPAATYVHGFKFLHDSNKFALAEKGLTSVAVESGADCFGAAAYFTVLLRTHLSDGTCLDKNARPVAEIQCERIEQVVSGEREAEAICVARDPHKFKFK